MKARQSEDLHDRDGRPAARVREDDEEETHGHVHVAHGQRGGAPRTDDAQEHAQVQQGDQHQAATTRAGNRRCTRNLNYDRLFNYNVIIPYPL